MTVGHGGCGVLGEERRASGMNRFPVLVSCTLGLLSSIAMAPLDGHSQLVGLVVWNLVPVAGDERVDDNKGRAIQPSVG